MRPAESEAAASANRTKAGSDLAPISNVPCSVRRGMNLREKTVASEHPRDGQAGRQSLNDGDVRRQIN